MGIHLDTFAVFEVADLEGYVGDDGCVASSKPLWNPSGEVQPMLNEELCVRADLLRRVELSHHDVCVVVGCPLHLTGDVSELLDKLFTHCFESKVVDLPVGESQLQFTKFVSFCALLRKRRRLLPEYAV